MRRSDWTSARGRSSGTHGRDGLPPYRTLRDGLDELADRGPVQPLSKRKRAVYARIPPGGNWRSLPVGLQRSTMGAAYHAEGGKSGWWRRLSWDAPAPTILGMPDHSSTALVHPDEIRCLSVNECAALQSFPSKTRFVGTPRSQYQQIGNAVPPLLAARLGQHVSEFLAGARYPRPAAPPWRQISANRRIGTHGWATLRRRRTAVTLTAAVRSDHVWHFVEDVAYDARPVGGRRSRKAA
jgi:DNA (cytosine-5)-methyltransferase 1